MSKEHLKPIRTKKQAVDLGRKGGQAKSKAKTIENIKKGLKTASEKTKEKWIKKLVEDPKKYAELIVGLSIDIPKYELEADQKIRLLSAMASVYRSIHPTSLKVQGEIGGTFVVKWADSNNNNTVHAPSAPSQIPSKPGENTPDAGGNQRGKDAGAGK